MAESNIITLPLLRGTLVASGPWQALLAKAANRVYPFQLGCMIRSNSSGTTMNTHGKGEFAVNDYAVVCKATAYGQGTLFIPDTTRITRVTAINATDDQFTISPARTVVAGEYLLGVGADTAANPLSTLNFDGSTINLFTDNVGNNANANAYLQTATGGWFRGWVNTGVRVVDLLITNSSGGVIAVKPFVTLGEELVP